MRRTFLLLCWLATDIALFIAAYAIAYFLRVGFIVSTDFPLDKYMQTTLIVAPFWIGTMLELGIFRLTRIQGSRKNLTHILFSCILASALFTLTYYFLHNNFFSRLLLVYAGLISLGFAVVWHLAFDSWQRKVLRKNPAAYPVLIVGLNREAERLIDLLEDKQSPFKPVAILDGQGTSKAEVRGVPVLGKLNKLEEVIKTLKPSHLIQCSNLEHTINLMSVCRQHKMTYLLLPSVLGAVEGYGEQIEGKSFIKADHESW